MSPPQASLSHLPPAFVSPAGHSSGSNTAFLKCGSSSSSLTLIINHGARIGSPMASATPRAATTPSLDHHTPTGEKKHTQGSKSKKKKPRRARLRSLPPRRESSTLMSLLFLDSCCAAPGAAGVVCRVSTQASSERVEDKTNRETIQQEGTRNGLHKKSTSRNHRFETSRTPWHHHAKDNPNPTTTSATSHDSRDIN